MGSRPAFSASTLGHTSMASGEGVDSQLLLAAYRVCEGAWGPGDLHLDGTAATEATGPVHAGRTIVTE